VTTPTPDDGPRPEPLFATPDGPPPSSPDPWTPPVPPAPAPVVPESAQLVGYAPEPHLAEGWDPHTLVALAPPPPSVPRDRLAVPAFVLAWLLAPVGVVVGVVAAVRARRAGRAGAGLALAAVVVGLALSVVVPTTFLPSSGAWARAVGATDPLGDVTAPTTAWVRQLREGHCLEALPEGTPRRVQVVPCDGREAARVVAVVPVRGDAWPGDDAVVRAVTDRCRVTAPAGTTVVALTPTATGWRAGDRSGTCVAGTEADI